MNYLLIAITLLSFIVSQGRTAVAHIYSGTHETDSKEASTNHSLPTICWSSLFQQAVVPTSVACPQNSLKAYYTHFIQSYGEICAAWNICHMIVTQQREPVLSTWIGLRNIAGNELLISKQKGVSMQIEKWSGSATGLALDYFAF